MDIKTQIQTYADVVRYCIAHGYVMAAYIYARMSARSFGDLR